MFRCLSVAGVALALTGTAVANPGLGAVRAAIHAKAPAVSLSGLHCTHPAGSPTGWYCDTALAHANVSFHQTKTGWVGFVTVLCHNASTTAQGCRP